jgi:hypothetical protein
MNTQFSRIHVSSLVLHIASVLNSPLTNANEELPIADTHLHYLQLVKAG